MRKAKLKERIKAAEVPTHAPFALRLSALGVAGVVLLLAAYAWPTTLCELAGLERTCELNTEIGAVASLVFGLASLAVAYYAGRSANLTGSRRVLLAACAFAVLGAAGVVGSMVFEWALQVPTNVRIFALSTGFLISSLLLAAGVLLPDRQVRAQRRTPGLVFAASLLAVIAFTAFENQLPAFFSMGRTLLSRVVAGVGALVFAVATVAYYRLYLKNRNPVTYAFIAALILLTLSAAGYAEATSGRDSLSWLGRIFRTLAALVLLYVLRHANAV